MSTPITAAALARDGTDFPDAVGRQYEGSTRKAGSAMPAGRGRTPQSDRRLGEHVEAAVALDPRNARLNSGFDSDLAELDGLDRACLHEELCAVLEREALDATPAHRRYALILAPASRTPLINLASTGKLYEASLLRLSETQQ